MIICKTGHVFTKKVPLSFPFSNVNDLVKNTSTYSSGLLLTLCYKILKHYKHANHMNKSVLLI